MLGRESSRKWSLNLCLIVNPCLFNPHLKKKWTVETLSFHAGLKKRHERNIQIFPVFVTIIKSSYPDRQFVMHAYKFLSGLQSYNGTECSYI